MAELTASTSTHPLYNQEQTVWRKLSHVREGLGGFRDGTYLIPHPREWKDHDKETPTIPTKKLLERRLLACYENFASTILIAKKSALFREQPTRIVGEPPSMLTPAPVSKPAAEANADPNAPTPPKPTPIRKPKKTLDEKASDLERWWENVDGRETAIDDFMTYAWDLAATFGHVWLYLDKPSGSVATTAADASRPFIRIYTPLDVLDWWVDEVGNVIGLLVREQAPRAVGEIAATAQFRTRLITTETWTLYDQGGNQIDSGPHGAGVLPAVQLFSQRRALYAHIGESVLSDPQLYIDLYNLTSEVRELLRKQTFSFINVALGTGPDATSVEDAEKLLGTQTGAANVLFSPGAAQMLSGDPSNVEAYHKEIERRLRTIYRLVGISWESDSKDAEAQGSLKLKREEMTTRLTAYADELEKADYAIAKIFYRLFYGGDAGLKRFETDKITIRYPDTFDVTPFDVVLQQAQAAISLNYPAAILKAIRKALLSKFLPDLPADDLAVLEAEIMNAVDDPTPMEKLTARMTAMKGKPGDVKPGDKQPPQDEKKAA